MRLFLFPAIAAALLSSTSAIAQRTTDNATTQSRDAFGKKVGDEQIGIYNPFDVRGFSAIEAGNARIEGLYFQQQAGPTDRLIEGSTMRVGISAQGYPFPAPTGIADYSLRKPGDKRLLSVVARYGPFSAQVGQLDLSLPVVDKELGVQAGIAYFNDNQHFGGTPQFLSMAVTPVWRPAEGVEIIPFWSSVHKSSDEAQTLVFTDGSHRPPRVARRTFAGQPWAQSESTSWNTGLIAKAPVLGFDVAAGVFRSISHEEQGAIDLLIDVTPEGRAANRLVIIDSGNKFAATSGEFRVSRNIDEGDRRHTLVATIKGRDQRRRYGGSDAISLGPTTWGEPDYRPKPDFTFGEKTRDHVQQTTVGLGYQLRWLNIGEFGVGLQKTDYKKDVLTPSGALPESHSAPWLLNANAAIELGRDLIVYGSFARGLEESPVAPDRATNRDEAPPAFRTEQKDAGIRWAIAPSLSAIAGVFEITKPYFNLDTANRFRQLGHLRHRGVELSIAGQVAKGLNVVAGTVFLDAEVTGELVDAGTIGSKPVNAIERHSVFSVDYRLPNGSPFSVDVFVEETGDRVANIQNTLVVPPRAVVAVGGRYRFKIGRSNALVRAQVGNIFNNYGYGMGNSGFYVYNQPRRLSLTLTADI